MVEGMLQGKSMHQAALGAGYSPATAAATIYRSGGTAKRVRAAVAKRQQEALDKAGIHTDIIVGQLVEIAAASIDDVLENDGSFDLKKARKRGVDHLIKKLKTRTRAIPQGKDSEGNEKPPIIETTNELEMYSRLDALRQLRENFGMKQEQRTNTLEETKRQEVEREIKEIMVADNCDEPTAAQILLDNIGDPPHLVPIIRRYIH